MSLVSSAGITGPQHNKQAFDVGGVNDTDIRSPAAGNGAATFSELLNETIERSSQQPSDLDQTAPLEPSQAAATNKVASGISQGRIINTGNPLDLAINGEGYFVLTDGKRDFYPATGSFAVDSKMSIVDPATGYHLKRIGTDGDADGFQTPGNSSTRVPYSMPLPPRATTEVAIPGNLSAGTPFSTLSTAFVETDSPNTWDMVLTSDSSFEN
jgi:flagellar hook protein FlgE